MSGGSGSNIDARDDGHSSRKHSLNQPGFCDRHEPQTKCATERRNCIRPPNPAMFTK
jgi:hypothetical protein